MGTSTEGKRKKRSEVSGSSGMGSSKASAAGNTSASGNMPPHIVNRGSRRNISVESIMEQVTGTPEEVTKCLWHQKVDRFNKRKLDEFAGVDFHYERMTYRGEDAKSILYRGRMIFGIAGIAFASQELQTAAMALMNEQFRAEYLRHRGRYMLVTENQVKSIVIQLYGMFDREGSHTENLEISFTQNTEVGLYHVDIVEAREQLRAGFSIVEVMGYTNQIVFFRWAPHVGRSTRLLLSNETKKVAMRKLVDLLKMIMNFMGDQVYSDDGESIVLVPLKAFQMIAKLNEDMIEVKVSISIVHPIAGEEEIENEDAPRTPPRPAVRVDETSANVVVRNDNQVRFGIGSREETPQS